MRHFVPPVWQTGYRYLSLADNVIAVRRERPVPVLMTYDPWNKAHPNVSNFFVLGRFIVSLQTETHQEYFHDMAGKSHFYHTWGIENRALAAAGDLTVGLTTAPLVEERGFLLRLTETHLIASLRQVSRR